MPNTYSWTFEVLDVLPTEVGLTNVVKKVQGTLTADDGLGHTASQLLVTTLGPPDPLDFVEFVDLLPANVVGWVELNMTPEAVDAWKATLDSRIYDEVEISALAPPWL